MAKLAAKNFPDFLKKAANTGSAALFYGPDSGLVNERAKALAKAVLGAEADALSLTELSEEKLRDDPALLADTLGAMSLLGGRSVVLLRDSTDRSAKPIEQALSGPSGNYLIVCAAELTPRSALRALFEGDARLATLACYKDEAGDLAAVIRQKFSEAGIAPARGVVEFLQAHLGNDRQVTLSELEKLVLYAGEEKTLSLEAVELLIGHNREAGLDNVAMAVADFNAGALEGELAQCFHENVQPVALLRAVQKHFHKLIGLRALVDSGTAPEQAVASARPPVFFRQVPAMTRQLGQWSRPRLTQAITLLYDAELACKSGTLPPTLLCRQALMRIAGAGRN